MSIAISQDCIQCGNCGFNDTGNYCSRCGTRLTSKRIGPFVALGHTLFQLDNLSSFLNTYKMILKSPSRNTIALVHDEHYHGHLVFICFSVSIYIFIQLAQLNEDQAIPLMDIWATIGVFISLVVGVFVNYRLCKKKSTMERSLHEFTKLTTLVLGYNVTFISIASAVALFNTEFGALTQITVAIPLVIYLVRVSKDFWKLGTKHVLIYYFISSMLGGLANLVSMFVIGFIIGL